MFVDSLHLVLQASRGKGHGWRSLKCLLVAFILFTVSSDHIFTNPRWVIHTHLGAPQRWQTTKDSAVWMESGSVFTDIKMRKREGRGSEKWRQENQSRAQGFVLHFPDLAPERRAFPSSEERISFPFILILFRSRAGYLYADCCGCRCLRGEPWRASH